MATATTTPAKVLPFPARRRPDPRCIAGEYRFEFEELPLMVQLGTDIGYLAGAADIAFYEEDGEGKWFAQSIYLDCYKDGERGLHKVHFVPAANGLALDLESHIHLAIYDQLENGKFNKTITDDVSDKLAELRGVDGDPN